MAADRALTADEIWQTMQTAKWLETALPAPATKPAPRSRPTAAQPPDPVRIELLKPPADILTRVIPARSYVCGPYGALSATTSLLGEGAVGKSKFLRMLMLHAAAGLPFLGQETLPGRYVYLSAEDEQTEVWRDVQKVLKAFTPEAQRAALTNFSLIDAVGRGLYFVGVKEGVASISATVDRIAAAVGTARMVAVDTLSRVNGAEENSNATMAVIESACARLAQRTGASVWITHHVAKAAAREQIADLHSGRGGSALGDNARGVLRLMPATASDVKGYEGIAPGEAERGDIVRLIHAKNSYGRRAEPVWLRRMADGMLQQFTPELKTEANVAEQMLAHFAAWWERSERKPFTKTHVCRGVAARGHLQEIWPRGVTQPAARTFFDAQCAALTFLRTDAKGYHGADVFTMNAATAEALLAKATAAERESEALWNEKTKEATDE